ncbi:MAG TPA: hypothetical protein VHZ76_05550, partial [Gammaproteobacteria bacterium]|nr:hypothetical protein [Gammaproteobacteria bacterium]
RGNASFVNYFGSMNRNRLTECLYSAVTGISPREASEIQIKDASEREKLIARAKQQYRGYTLEAVASMVEAAEFWYCEVKQHFSENPNYIADLAILADMPGLASDAASVIGDNWADDWEIVGTKEKTKRHEEAIETSLQAIERKKIAADIVEKLTKQPKADLEKLLARFTKDLQAINDFKKLLQLEPENLLENPNVLLNIGQLCELSNKPGDLETAYIYYLKAFDILQAGIFLSNNTRKNLALPHIKRLAEKKLPSAMMKLAKLHANGDIGLYGHDYQEAAKFMQTAAEINHHNHEKLADAVSFRIFALLHQVSILPYWHENKIDMSGIRHILHEKKFSSCADTRAHLHIFAKEKGVKFSKQLSTVKEFSEGILGSMAQSMFLPMPTLMPIAMSSIAEQLKPPTSAREKPVSLPLVDRFEKQLYEVLACLTSTADYRKLLAIEKAFSCMLPQQQVVVEETPAARLDKLREICKLLKKLCELNYGGENKKKNIISLEGLLSFFYIKDEALNYTECLRIAQEIGKLAVKVNNKQKLRLERAETGAEIKDEPEEKGFYGSLSMVTKPLYPSAQFDEKEQALWQILQVMSENNLPMAQLNEVEEKLNEMYQPRLECGYK